MKILIVDDHEMVREGIRLMLESQKKYDFIIDEAASGEMGVDKISSNNYDLIIMDYQLPKMSGADTTRKIVKMCVGAKILAMSNYDERTYIRDILRAGAKGFVLKNIGPEELVKAFEIIYNGGKYYSNEVAVKMIDFNDVVNSSEGVKVSIGKEDLNNTEKAILSLIANEYTNEEIAEILKLAKNSVDKYRQLLIKKLGVINTAGLTRKAIEFKLVDYKLS